MQNSVYFLVPDLVYPHCAHDAAALCGVEGIHTSVSAAIRHARDNLKLEQFQIIRYPLMNENTVSQHPNDAAPFVVYTSFDD